METQNKLLQQYIKDISIYPLLTKKREEELSKIIQRSTDASDIEKAKEEMILANLRLVVKFALNIKNKMGFEENLTIMDFISEGNIGLMRAVTLFDTEAFKTRFSTYASNAITRRIKRAIKNSRFVRVPVPHFKYFMHYKSLIEQYGENVSDAILKNEMKITQETLDKIKIEEKHLKVTHVDIEDLLDIIPSDCQDLRDIIINKESRAHLIKKINELNDSERDVIYYTFFANNNITIDEIAQKRGITREAIRMTLKKAIRKLRQKIIEERAINKVNGKNKGEKYEKKHNRRSYQNHKNTRIARDLRNNKLA